MVLLLTVLRGNAESVPEKIFSEAWVRELLQHPLLCTAYAPAKDGSLIYDRHHFQDQGLPLSPDLSKRLSAILSTADSYVVDKKAAPADFLNPDILIRLENEQQFIDLMICFKTASVCWYANGEVSDESQSNSFKLKRTAAEAIREITAHLFPAASS